MIPFVLGAALLTALALAFVLPGLLRATAGPAPATPRQPLAAALLALALPAASVALYLALGTPAALAPEVAAPAPQAPGPMSQERIEAMVQRLAERLRAQPDDAEGWHRLARSYETLGRYADAVQAYRELEKLQAPDADLLTEQAVTLAMSLGERLSGEPERLIERALALDPQHVQALALAGSAAYERGDYARAVERWKLILTQVPPEAEVAKTIEAGIRRAEAQEAARRREGR